MKFFPKIRNKIGNGFRAIGRGFLNLFTKVSATWSVLVQRSGPVYSNRDYKNFAEETYMKNSIAFRCIDMIAKSFASVPWNLFREVNGERVEVDNHPVNDLLKRPNPRDSWYFLMVQLSAYLPIAGNSYIEQVKPTTGPNRQYPHEMYVLRPDRVTINVSEQTGTVSGYTYTAHGQTVNFEVDVVTGKSDILHIKQFHPLDDWYGMATTEPAAREIDTSNEGVDFNKNLLENRAVPGMMFFYNDTMTQAQFERLEKRLKEKYSGGVNAGKNMILEGAHDAKPYAFTPAEIEFLESNRELATRIAMTYGVPPQLLGIPGSQTFANFEQARLAFWEETIIPLLSHSAGEINNWLFSEEDLFLVPVLDQVPALEPKRASLWERSQKADFITINEKRDMVDMEAVDGGDVILVPANMLPLNAEPTEEEINEPDIEEEEEGIEEEIEE
jgi:HK97 family phage portal protein